MKKIQIDFFEEICLNVRKIHVLVAAVNCQFHWEAAAEEKSLNSTGRFVLTNEKAREKSFFSLLLNYKC